MKLFLKADRLIDGTGAPPIQNGAVLVDDGRIAQVGAREEIRLAPGEPVDEIEVPGGSILPGFIEAHTHIHCSAEADAYRHVTTESDATLIIRGVQAVRAALGSGVTTMRDLGSKNQVVFPIREAIESGVIPGPRLLRGGHAHHHHRRPLQYVRHRGRYRRRGREGYQAAVQAGC